MAIPTPSPVSIFALRSLLRLVSDLKDLPDGSPAQRRLALERLSTLLGAKVALWVEVPRVVDGLPFLQCDIEMGWSTTSERALFHYYLNHQCEPVDPVCPRLMDALAAPQATVLRNDIVADGDWYGSEHVQDIRRAASVDSFILGLRVGEGQRVTTISLHRPWGDRPFSDDDRAILDAFRRETPWLDTVQEPDFDVLAGSLSPRLSAVLRGLLRGLSEKQVAAELGLSTHTTHDYVKAIYQRFGVRSRGELFARHLEKSS